jgi:hypothetical protein
MKLNYSTKASIVLLVVLGVILCFAGVLQDTSAVASVTNRDCAVQFKSDAMSLCYFLPYRGNFGDELGPAAVDRILETHFRCASGIRKLDLADAAVDAQRHRDGTTCLFTLGSIFHTVRSGDHVWGTGINPYWQDQQWSYPTRLQVYSVRGPKTEALVKEKLGVPYPIPHGDPGFVVPLLYPEFASMRMKQRTSRGTRFCFVPHFHDVQRAMDALPRQVKRVSARRAWRPVVKKIATQCDHVASSSLHGIVVADALGIPSMWFQWNDTMTAQSEGHFKYLDYMGSIGRDDIHGPVSDVRLVQNRNAYSSVLDMHTRWSIVNRTIASFPFQLFQAVPTK